MEEVTKVLPAIALRGTTILPDMIVHFDISRAKSVRAVEEAMLGDQKIFLITQRDPDTEVPGLLDVYKIGTIAVIKQVVRMPKDILRILVEAESRAELLISRKRRTSISAPKWHCLPDRAKHSFRISSRRQCCGT